MTFSARTGFAAADEVLTVLASLWHETMSY